MPFPSDGRNHHSAIKNEKATKGFLETFGHNLFPNLKKGKYVVESRGGPSNKADNVIIDSKGNKIFISDKEKKSGITVGSFDYVNSSLAISEMISIKKKSVSHISKLLNEVEEVRKRDLNYRQKSVPKFRKLVSSACHETLKNFGSDDLIYLLNRYLIQDNLDMHLIITDCKNDKRYIFSFKDHPIIDLLKKDYVPSIALKDGKSSGRILFKKNEDVVDIGLRIRLHTNNGVTALLGAGGSNSNSCFVIKFQQDKIVDFLNRTNHIEV